MRRFVLFVSVVTLLVVAGVSSPAHAKRWNERKLGIGAVVGMPTGLTLDVRMNNRISTNVAVGMGTLSDDPYLHLELKVAFWHLLEGRKLTIPLYVGVGGYAAGHQRTAGSDGVSLGARFPLGIVFQFRAPVQIFVEGALRMPFVAIGHTRDTGLDVGGAAGFKIFF